MSILKSGKSRFKKENNQITIILTKKASLLTGQKEGENVRSKKRR
jgi:hypothetical protein